LNSEVSQIEVLPLEVLQLADLEGIGEKPRTTATRFEYGLEH
jgi:hypothetical protein